MQLRIFLYVFHFPYGPMGINTNEDLEYVVKGPIHDRTSRAVNTQLYQHTTLNGLPGTTSFFYMPSPTEADIAYNIMYMYIYITFLTLTVSVNLIYRMNVSPGKNLYTVIYTHHETLFKYYQKISYSFIWNSKYKLNKRLYQVQ